MALTSERRDQMIEGLSQWIRANGLRSPALLFLEANKPLAPLGSQALLFLQPLLGLVGPAMGWFRDDHVFAEYAILLEDSVNIERILDRLEGPSAG